MHATSVLVRAASTADGAELEALAAEVELSFLASRDLFRPGGVALVARSGSTLVGFVAAQLATDEAEILDLAVANAVRRQGVGRRLLEEVLRYLAARGAVRVLLEVRPSNMGALALYERMGFVQVGRRPRYYKDGEDALLMALSHLPT